MAVKNYTSLPLLLLLSKTARGKTARTDRDHNVIRPCLVPKEICKIEMVVFSFVFDKYFSIMN